MNSAMDEMDDLIEELIVYYEKVPEYLYIEAELFAKLFRMNMLGRIPCNGYTRYVYNGIDVYIRKSNEIS